MKDKHLHQEILKKCDECGKETDVSIHTSCWCANCEKDFCSTFDTLCFKKYHQKNDECKIPRCCEITNPAWICNLVKNLREE